MSNVRLKILGSVSPYCKGSCSCPGYMVFDDSVRIMLDCGFGATANMCLPEDLSNLHIFLSHYHKDHYADLFALRYAIQSYKNKGLLNGSVYLYLPRSYEGQADYTDFVFIKDSVEGFFDIVEYDENSKFQIGCFSLRFFKTLHAVDSLSVSLDTGTEKIVYSGDMGCHEPEEYAAFCRGADVFLCESSFLQDEGAGSRFHLNARQAAELAASAGVKQLVLTHFWPERSKLDYCSEAKAYFENVRPAVENEIIEV